MSDTTNEGQPNTLEDLQKLASGGTLEPKDAAPETVVDTTDHLKGTMWEQKAADAQPEAATEQAPAEAPKVEEQPAAEGVEAQGVPEGAEAAPYTPDYNYKYMGEERQIPEEFRGLIKDSQGEQKIKDIFTKYDGFEKLSQDREIYKNQVEDLTKVRDEAVRLAAERNYIKELVRKKDIGSLMSALGVGSKELLTHAEGVATAAENVGLDGYDKMTEDSRELHALRLEKQMYEQQKTLDAMNKTSLELNSEYSKATVAPLVQQYEKMNGAGSFDRGVRQLGSIHFERTGETVPASQLVSAFLIQSGIPMSPSSQPQQGVHPQGAAIPHQNQVPVQYNVTGVQQPVQPQVQPASAAMGGQKPVIPTSGGTKGVTPIRPQINTLEDIQKELEKMGG